MNKQLIDLVKKLKELDVTADVYLQSIPKDINPAFFDNGYVNALQLQKDMLIDVMFGDMAEDVSWFLYEFEAGKSAGPHCITAGGTEYTYHTNEDYYKYLENCEI
jgi:hypothetical protein